jgi:hypothetical protein
MWIRLNNENRKHLWYDTNRFLRLGRSNVDETAEKYFVVCVSVDNVERHESVGVERILSAQLNDHY